MLDYRKTIGSHEVGFPCQAVLVSKLKTNRRVANVIDIDSLFHMSRNSKHDF